MSRDKDKDKDAFGRTIDRDKRRLRFVSVSQIAKFSPLEEGGCNRKWFFDKVLSVKEPSTQAQDVGVDVHAQNEHYLRTGEDTLGTIARQGKHFLPRPLTEGPGLLIEYPMAEPSDIPQFEAWRDLKESGRVMQRQLTAHRAALPQSVLAPHDIPVIGYIDLINMRDYWVDTEGTRQPMSPDTIEIHDHKTTKNVAYKAGVRLDELVQMLGYAKWAHGAFGGLNQFRLSHGYLQTKGRGAEKRSTLISLDVLNNRWDGISEQVKRMTEVVRETDVSKVEPNYGACNSFGRQGCYYKSMCPRDVERTFEDLLGGSQPMNMLEMLKSAGQAQGAVPAATQPQPQTQPQTQAQAPTTVEQAKAILLAQESKSDRPMSCSCGQPVVESQTMKLADGKWWHLTQTPQPHPMPVAAPPVVAQAPVQQAPVQQTAPARELLPLSDNVVLRQRDRGYFVRIRNINGMWLQFPIKSDGTDGDPAGTQPEHWYKDIWEVWTAPVAATPPVTPATPAINGVVANGAHGAPPGMNGKAAVVPPDAPASVAPANAQALPQGTVLPPEVEAAMRAAGVLSSPAGDSKQLVMAGSDAVAPAATATTGAAPAAEAPKGKGGRPKKNAAAAGAVAPASALADDELTLFVNVMAVGLELRDLESYVAELTKKLAASGGVVDIRLAPAEHPALGYDKWKAALAIAVQQNPPTGLCQIFVDGDPIKSVVLSALLPLATGGVVRGVR